MTKPFGVKYDQEKPRMGLLPPLALSLVADVLTFGAKKYAPDNWRYVDDGPSRYLDAALRHITAYMSGEMNDQESGLPHMAHALCCLMFITELDEEDRQSVFPEDTEEYDEYDNTPFEDLPTEDYVRKLDTVIAAIRAKAKSQEKPAHWDPLLMKWPFRN